MEWSTKSTRTDVNDSDNPLLMDFEFPPFASVEPRHVRPGIRSLLQKLESDLEVLKQSEEPTWEKLVEPLEKDFEELRSANEDVQVVCLL